MYVVVDAKCVVAIGSTYAQTNKNDSFFYRIFYPIF